MLGSFSCASAAVLVNARCNPVKVYVARDMFDLYQDLGITKVVVTPEALEWHRNRGGKRNNSHSNKRSKDLLLRYKLPATKFVLYDVT